MGTNASYGGSNSKDWKQVRDLWSGLGGGDLPPAPPADGPPPDSVPPGDVPLPADYKPSAALDALGNALAVALGKGLPAVGAQGPSVGSLLPRRRGSSGGDGGDGGDGGAGGGAGGTSGNTGRTGGGKRQVPQQAAKGGAAIGAAVAYRDRDASALGEFGATLAELDAMTPRQRNNAILNLVLGDAGHPDEAAIRAAALEQVKVLTGPDGAARDSAEAVRAFVGELVVRLCMVELQDQIIANVTTKDEARRRETALKQWIASKVHHLDLAKYGTVTARDCHKAAFRMAGDALRLLRKRK